MHHSKAFLTKLYSYIDYRYCIFTRSIWYLVHFSCIWQIYIYIYICLCEVPGCPIWPARFYGKLPVVLVNVCIKYTKIPKVVKKFCYSYFTLCGLVLVIAFLIVSRLVIHLCTRYYMSSIYIQDIIFQREKKLYFRRKRARPACRIYTKRFYSFGYKRWHVWWVENTHRMSIFAHLICTHTSRKQVIFIHCTVLFSLLCQVQ